MLEGVDALRLGGPLQWEMVEPDRGTALTDRRGRVDAAVRSGRFPPISNCPQFEPAAGYKIVVSGGPLPELSDRSSGPLRLAITIQARSEPVYASAEKVLAVCGDAAQAWYGTLTPNITNAELSRQLFAGPVRTPGREDPMPSLGLPALELFPRPPLDPPIPKLIGWIKLLVARNGTPPGLSRPHAGRHLAPAVLPDANRRLDLEVERRTAGSTSGHASQGHCGSVSPL